ncbi:MAG: argininosuccinate lyase [Firmicutes bacterium]|nr:argininosuccinate lyase [Bacillota bacterium]
MKAWGGRFEKRAGVAAEAFTSSISVDARMYAEDIEGSIAHARMLAAKGIIPADEAETIVKALDEIRREIEQGAFEFREADEDIHLNIERRLIEKVGEVGGKLHTARSRNDQVALDSRLYTARCAKAVSGKVETLQRAIIAKAKAHLGAIMPGYTHLQRAQPILFSHHLMAYFWMLQRDRERLGQCARRASVSPLGACALAGTTFPIDPSAVASELGFSSTFENSIDAVSDRDYIVEFIFCCAVLMMHLSRLCEELVLWSSAEFGYIEMDDSLSTGSSIMPQKKNPDVAEIVRGKTGRLYGDLVGLLTTMKALPLAYNSDMQEDKERLFDSSDTVEMCLEACTQMISTMSVNEEQMAANASAGFTNATEVADYLASRGTAFRRAHEVSGRLVRYCKERGVGFADLSLDEFRRFSEKFDRDIYDFLLPETCVRRRSSPGGTSPERVGEQIERAEKLLAALP